ncbi:hAT family dimerization domain-containing protein [Pimephales promelas]|nr:hAT family dimerization domain-containing protein [Pimephales promelas]
MYGRIRLPFDNIGRFPPRTPTDKIHERIIGIVKCKESTGQYFVSLVSELTEKLNLDLSKCIGDATDVLNDIAVFFRDKRMNVWESESQGKHQRRLSPIGETRSQELQLVKDILFTTINVPRAQQMSVEWEKLKMYQLDEFKVKTLEDKTEDEGVEIRCKECSSCNECPLCCYKILGRFNLMSKAYHLLGLAYKFLLTLSITQVACERTFSTLKFIKTRLRSKLSQEHLEAFMLMATERDILFSLDSDVIDH